MAERNPVEPNPNRRVRPLGAPEDWGTQDVARLATVTDADKVEARDYWRENAPGVVVQRDGSAVDARPLIDARERRRP